MQAAPAVPIVNYVRTEIIDDFQTQVKWVTEGVHGELLTTPPWGVRIALARFFMLGKRMATRPPEQPDRIADFQPQIGIRHPQAFGRAARTGILSNHRSLQAAGGLNMVSRTPRMRAWTTHPTTQTPMARQVLV